MTHALPPSLPPLPPSTLSLSLSLSLSVSLSLSLQARSQGVARASPVRKNIGQRQLILSKAFTLHIELHSELQWRRNALNVL